MEKINLSKILATLFVVAFTSITIASDTTSSSANVKTLVQFQVIQTEMVINSSTVSSATVIPPEHISDPYAVKIILKTESAARFSRITEENIGKRMNITFNNSVISSPTIQSKLGREFLITGLTKKQAKQFVDSLTLSKHKA